MGNVFTRSCNNTEFEHMEVNDTESSHILVTKMRNMYRGRDTGHWVFELETWGGVTLDVDSTYGPLMVTATPTRGLAVRNSLRGEFESLVRTTLREKLGITIPWSFPSLECRTAFRVWLTAKNLRPLKYDDVRSYFHAFTVPVTQGPNRSRCGLASIPGDGETIVLDVDPCDDVERWANAFAHKLDDGAWRATSAMTDLPVLGESVIARA